MRPALATLSSLLLVLAGCSGGGSGGGGTGGGEDPGPVAPGGGPTCGAVRLTSYKVGASQTGWCEYSRQLSVLPDFVRKGMTLAIAEPWDGGSYGGAPGEACGECWEIATLQGTQVVMVHDLCPVEGNPLCAGSHFHFDLAGEAMAALEPASGLWEASARRVGCPVSGNVFLDVLDRSGGYLRFAVVNHRVPVRLVEYRAVGGGSWRPAKREGGAWFIDDAGSFGPAAQGGLLRITSAQGEVLEVPSALGPAVAKGSTFDLGAQLTDRAPASGPACVFRAPADVYVDGFGGIDQVRWRMNPWNSRVQWSEVKDGCAGGSGACLRVAGMAQWDGFHIYYVQPFATSSFARLSLATRLASGTGTIQVTASAGGTPCTWTAVKPGATWSTTTIDLAAACAKAGSIDAVSVQATGGSGMVLLLDDVRFLP